MAGFSENIPLFRTNLPSKKILQSKLIDCIYSQPLNEGQNVYDFEESLAKFLCVPEVAAVSSGSAALHLALIMAGVSHGDYVISTSLTAEPTNTVIRSVGAKIIYCDLDPKTGLLNLDSLSLADLKKSKAFMLVHYGGYVQNIQDILSLCSQYSVSVIEDCAHSLGSRYNEQVVGTLGDYGCFSFQAIKQITTIEGGAIITKHSDQLPIIKQRRWFGLQKSQPRLMTNITLQGFKYNFNNVHAQIGILQLNDYAANLKKVLSIAARYKSEISCSEYIQNLYELPQSINSNWLFLTKVDNVEHATNFFQQNGITAGRVHKLSHQHDYLKAERILSGTEIFERHLFHIPIGAWMSETEINRVLDAIRNYKGIINDKVI